MATYVNDLRLKEIATGDESGTWGTSTNTNLELIGEAFSFGTEAITTNADTHTTTIADGSTDPGRSLYLKYTGTLDSACTITIGPNTVSKLWFIENGTSGSQNIIISQGSGANVTIPAGHVKAVYSDGAGSGAAIVDAFTDLNLAGTTTVSVLSVSSTTTFSDDVTFTGASNNIVFDQSDDCLEFADNAKAKFGASDDLQIYHDGSNSRIQEGGTGSLLVRGTNLQLQDSDGFDYLTCTDGGDGGTVVLKHLGSSVLSTNTGGITVTSAINDLTIAAGNIQTNTSNNLSINTPNSLRINIDSNNDGTAENFIIGHNQTAVDASNNVLLLVQESGKVSIGGTNPNATLQVGEGTTSGDATNPAIQIGRASTYRFGMYASTEGAVIENKNGDDGIQFRVKTKGEAMRIDGGTGNVGINESSPSSLLHLGGATNKGIEITSSTSNAGYLGVFQDQAIFSINRDGADGSFADTGKAAAVIKMNSASTDSNIVFQTTTSNNAEPTEKMRIASNGSIGMGTTPPSDTHTGWTQLFIGQKGSVISENATGVHGLDGTFVTDNMYVDSDTGAFAYIEANESSAYRQEAGIHQFFTQASGSAGAAVTLSEKMRIASDGKVGIGESAPANAKLEILQAGDHDAHSTHGIAIHSTGNTNFTSMYMGVEDGIDSAYIQSVALDGSFTSKSLLLNANGGKVGIGINAPSKTLQIESGSTADDGLFLSHSSGTVYAKLSVNNPGTDNDTLFGSVSNNGLRFVSNNFERMRLGASGEFMHNTTSASTSFTIQGNTTADVLTVLSGSTANANVGVAVFRDGGAEFCGQITCNGSTNSVSYTTSSDARLKNVLGEAKGLEIINKLNPVHFEWKKSGIKQDGLIAQEVEPILPNAVTYNEESDVYSMDYIKLVTPLIKAIQEQQEQIDALQSEIKTLKGE